ALQPAGHQTTTGSRKGRAKRDPRHGVLRLRQAAGDARGTQQHWLRTNLSAETLPTASPAASLGLPGWQPRPRDICRWQSKPGPRRNAPALLPALRSLPGESVRLLGRIPGWQGPACPVRFVWRSRLSDPLLGPAAAAASAAGAGALRSAPAGALAPGL